MKNILGFEIGYWEISELVEKVKKAAEELPANFKPRKQEQQENQEETNPSPPLAPAFPLRPSSALKPLRDLYYSLVNYDKPGTIPTDPIDGQTRMKFALGHLIEDHLVSFIKLVYEVPHESQRITYGTIVDKSSGERRELSGELDFTLKIDGELILGDSKSAAQYPFKNSIPQEDYIAQLQLYMHSEWAQSQGIKKAQLWYYNKNDSDLRVIEFEYNKELAEALIARFQLAYDLYKLGRLPPREAVLGPDWKANYSAFRTYDNAMFEATANKRISIKVPKKFVEFEGDNKEALRWLVINYENALVTFADETKPRFAELGAKGLILKGGTGKVKLT